MHPLLRVLDDLAYVLESGACDHSGELKFELGELCKRLEGDEKLYAIQDREKVAADLRDALTCYRSGDKLTGLNKLSSISRSLWAQARDQRFYSLKDPRKDPKKEPSEWHEGLGHRLLLVGYLTFLPAFIAISIRGLFSSGLSGFLYDLGILSLVYGGICGLFVIAAILDHRMQHRSTPP
jgi:hypothetical protein